MSIGIRLLDLASDDELTRAHEVVEEALAYGRPYASRTSLLEHLTEWRYQDPTSDTEIWGGFEGEDLVAVGFASYPLNDNTTLTWGIPIVSPHARGRGVGGALLEHLLDAARSRGRAEFHVGAELPTADPHGHPTTRFAQAHGFTTSWVQLQRRVRLPVPADLLSRLHEESAAHYGSDYTLETYLGGAPEHRQESLCEASNRLGVDAPSGDVEFEEETLTPEQYRAYLQVERSQDRERLTVLAVHTQSQTVAAFTDLIMPSGSPTHVWQGGTFVRADHRGHRLGMAVKVANLQALQERFPDRTQVTTSNADTNKWMVAINEALGFEILEVNPIYVHRFAS